MVQLVPTLLVYQDPATGTVLRDVGAGSEGLKWSLNHLNVFVASAGLEKSI